MTQIETESGKHEPDAREYVEAYWVMLAQLAEVFKQPPPDKEIAHHLTVTLETSWEALIAQLRHSSVKDKIHYWRQLTRDFSFQEKLDNHTWRQMLELRAARWAESYNQRDNRSFGQVMSQTEGRIAVMTSGLVGGHGLLNDVLNLYDNERNIKPEAYSLFLVMTAFNASLPWNRTGSNPITLSQINLATAAEASQYIRQRLTNISTM